MVSFKSGITATMVALGGLCSGSASANPGGAGAEEKQPAAAISSTTNTDWLALTAGGVAVLSAVGATAAVVRQELRKNASSSGPEQAGSHDTRDLIEEGVAFIHSLQKLVPEGPEGDDMRSALEIKELQLQGGWVSWDWRPGVRLLVESLLPDAVNSMAPWQSELRSAVSCLPERPAYGFPAL